LQITPPVDTAWVKMVLPRAPAAGQEVDTMTQRQAGDFDYQTLGHTYSQHRRADPRIAAMVHEALGSALTVLNVGAGPGSYEPLDRYVLSIEPSAAMRAQRPRHLAPAIDAAAEALPLDDRSVDASMAVLTVHHWSDRDKGLNELVRVTRGPIVVLTFDGDALDRYWLAHYAPELIEAERKRYPAIAVIRETLGGAETRSVPIPIDCVDGFTEAFYARPEQFLDARVRGAQSAWGFVDDAAKERFVRRLGEDLRSGAWDARFGHWRHMPFFEGALRLVVGGVSSGAHRTDF
jgi:SAM-dependent methyltransferase